MDGTQGDTQTRDALTQLMDDRRLELQLRWAEVARRAGMAVQNLGRIRRGSISISWEAAQGIEDALRWERGSVDAVLRGDLPTPLPDEDPTGHPGGGPPARVEPGTATWGDLRRELAWWHGRLRDTPEDYQRLLYLLDLSAQLEDSPVSTQGGAQFDAQG